MNAKTEAALEALAQCTHRLNRVPTADRLAFMAEFKTIREALDPDYEAPESNPADEAAEIARDAADPATQAQKAASLDAVKEQEEAIKQAQAQRAASRKKAESAKSK